MNGRHVPDTTPNAAMMEGRLEHVFAALKYLARRFHGRWSALDDALTVVRSSSGAPTSEGERTRRMLENAFRQQTYLVNERDAVQTDRANALKKLAKPLAEALGHIVTIELADERLKELDAAQTERLRELSAAERVERGKTVYARMIETLHRHGIVRGDHEVITDDEWAVVARYLRRKVEQRVGPLPPIRNDRTMRRGSRRLHPFWNPFAVPQS